MHWRAATAVIAAVLTFTACDGLVVDVNTIPFAGADGGMDVDLADADPDADADASTPPGDMPPDDAADLADIADMRDVRPPPDGGDAGDVADGDVDVTPPMCAIPHDLDPTKCNPLEEGKCPENGLCNLAFVMGLQLSCLPRNTEGTLGRDAPCAGAGDCVEHLTCFNWRAPTDPDPRGRICSQFCILATNEGCTVDEFCTGTASVPDVEGVGWCTPRCDPYDPDACPVGETCSIDFNFPGATCLPEFRCVELTDARVEGDECGPGMRVAECARGLTCYDVGASDYRCVRPCDSDADCAGTCGQPDGPWRLRRCQ